MANELAPATGRAQGEGMKIPDFLAGLTIAWAASAVPTARAADPVTLKEAARGHFLIGTAVSAAQIAGEDRAGVAVIEAEFNAVTAENAMKWEPIHPEPDRYDFALADAFVKFGEQRGMFIVGHTLMWHQQTPKWVFQDAAGRDVGKEELLRRLRAHIATVVGRYRGKVRGWDVVNEAIRDEDGQLRTDQPWYRILGDEGVFAAFEAAHAADPDAALYYNDYALENQPKREGVLKLVQAIRARGLRIDGVGTQGHFLMDWPTVTAVEETVEAFQAAGFKLMVTELDVTMLPRPEKYYGAEISKVFQNAPELDPYRDGLPAEAEAALAKRYGELFAAWAKHPGAVTRVTLWGGSDGPSWLNDWPIRGRTDYPLLFDRAYRPKAAHAAAVAALQAARR